ncbi:hypothetical protein Z517_03123 [Fonsecaea pedrosoi CBS 271.37]|uniref:Unplaced genomic scaffold supercont1.2, whole genome shotgun sequence n=1 Tax=Fonsecaea pedrosoi CBS 271.37 TaxID=1442368 RepID=A0A0D2FB86_9EURO|nr:uncharacterized protein Z517_03123 [Fonsecaea pedrosoi CBS 271.37]KIW83877.1 hypothetical protein Z517_03123 [Fonsecaea pedrosoi CBS 271.37]
MLGNSLRSSVVSIWLYFVLNMLVTVTNKQIVSRTACPWLLTASHAFTTFIATGAISRLQKPNSAATSSTSTATSTFVPRPLATCGRLEEEEEGADDDGEADHRHRDREGDGTSLSLRAHLRVLLPFSLLYTLNIALSNLALGLVTLSMHQTIRATAPVITVLVSIVWLGSTWREYPAGVYGAMGLTICGVIIATNAASSSKVIGHDRAGLVIDPTRTTTFGFTVTLLSAVLAVLKTVFTNELQRPHRASRWGLGLPSTRLVQYLALYAVNQAVLLASWAGEIQGLTTNVDHGPPSTLTLELGGRPHRVAVPWPWLWLLNALAAAMLNLSSFEANKRCGPLTMAIAANMKQVVILLMVICLRDVTEATNSAQDRRARENTVIVGSLITTVGGIWYAFASARMKRR